MAEFRVRAWREVGGESRFGHVPAESRSRRPANLAETLPRRAGRGRVRRSRAAAVQPTAPQFAGPATSSRSASRSSTISGFDPGRRGGSWPGLGTTRPLTSLAVERAVSRVAWRVLDGRAAPARPVFQVQLEAEERSLGDRQHACVLVGFGSEWSRSELDDRHLESEAAKLAPGSTEYERPLGFPRTRTTRRPVLRARVGAGDTYARARSCLCATRRPLRPECVRPRRSNLGW